MIALRKQIGAVELRQAPRGQPARYLTPRYTRLQLEQAASCAVDLHISKTVGIRQRGPHRQPHATAANAPRRPCQGVDLLVINLKGGAPLQFEPWVWMVMPAHTMNGMSSGGISTKGRIMSRSSCSRMWQ